MEAPQSEPLGDKGKPGLIRGTIDFCICIALLNVLALLMANVYVVKQISDYNDRSCKAAVLWATKAVLDGRDDTGIRQAAMLGLNNCAPTLPFSGHPEFTQFREMHHSGVRALQIQTRVLAHVPAPFLILNAKFNQDGTLPILRTYVVEIKSKESSR